MEISITSIDRSPGGGTCYMGTVESYSFEALVFPEASQYGIDGGQVTRLCLLDGPRERGGRELLCYEQGWKLRPEETEQTPSVDWREMQQVVVPLVAELSEREEERERAFRLKAAARLLALGMLRQLRQEAEQRQVPASDADERGQAGTGRDPLPRVFVGAAGRASPEMGVRKMQCRGEGRMMRSRGGRTRHWPSRPSAGGMAANEPPTRGDSAADSSKPRHNPARGPTAAHSRPQRAVRGLYAVPAGRVLARGLRRAPTVCYNAPRPVNPAHMRGIGRACLTFTKS